MKKKQGQAEIIKKVLRYVRPYGVFLLISVVCAAISSLLALAMPILEYSVDARHLNVFKEGMTGSVERAQS